VEIYYQIYKEQHLIIQKYIGIWSSAIYKSYCNNILINPDFKEVNTILTDFLDVNLEPAFLDLDELISIRNNIIKIKYNNVMIVNTPKNTATAHLYQDALDKLGHNYIYCSTYEQAFLSLGLKKDRKKLLDIIHDFNLHLIKFTN